MSIRLLSSTLWGLEGCPVDVEVDVNTGLPSFSIVGMPATVVREARERVRTAIRNSGYSFPMGRVTINLAPADLPKPMPVFDLAIALGILAASGQLPSGEWTRWLLLGELSLDGSLRPVRGLLPLASAAAVANAAGVALGCSGKLPWEARWLTDAPLIVLDSLRTAVNWAKGLLATVNDAGGVQSYPVNNSSGGAGFSRYHQGLQADLNDIRGQTQAKRALEIAAAGGHGLMLVGPPGTGKSLLASALPAIMPPLNKDEEREVATIYSTIGQQPPPACQRPFRRPHHSLTRAGLIGGGTIPQPGELSLAHNGILLLEELPLFRREVLDALREPLEDGRITISRLGRQSQFPCRVTLVATGNPCRCGYFGDPRKPCRCTEYERRRYWATMPGPVLDRIDIFVAVPRVPYGELAAKVQEVSLEEIRRRVMAAREIQRVRFRGEAVSLNAAMGRFLLDRHCPMKKEARQLLQIAYEKYHLSVRGYDRVLRVARTIADLEQSHWLESHHVAEALAFRLPAFSQ